MVQKELNSLHRSINFDLDVFEKLEELRGNRAHFRSEFVNIALREKLNMPKKREKR